MGEPDVPVLHAEQPDVLRAGHHVRERGARGKCLHSQTHAPLRAARTGGGERAGGQQVGDFGGTVAGGRGDATAWNSRADDETTENIISARHRATSCDVVIYAASFR